MEASALTTAPPSLFLLNGVILIFNKQPTSYNEGTDLSTLQGEIMIISYIHFWYDTTINARRRTFSEFPRGVKISIHNIRGKCGQHQI